MAFDGDTVAVKVPVEPTTRDIVEGFKETPVTETLWTVTEHVAFFDPSAVVTVMVAEPTAFAVTVPSEETVATEVLLDDQETSLFVALEGLTVAINRDVSPTVKAKEDWDNETPVTG